MVISKILGGLGNQLSAYAWGYSVAKYLGQELVLDVSDYINLGYVRPYCLDNKVRSAYPAWDGPTYQILDTELDFSPKYIASEQMLHNAAALLEV